MSEVSIKNAIIMWFVLIVLVTIVGYLAGLKVMAALALGALIALIALTTFYPVTNFDSIVTPEGETKMYFLILVITVAFLILYLCNKILVDRRGAYFVYG